MKVSIALFAVICVVGVYSDAGKFPNVTPDQLARITAEVEECARANNIGSEVLENMKNGIPPTPSRNLNCFSACVLKHNGVMNADGSTNYKPNDSDIGKKCKDLRGADDCETAGQIVACLHKNNLIPHA